MGSNIGVSCRSRKVLLLGFIALVVLLYWWPSWLTFNSQRLRGEVIDVCVDAKLDALRPRDANPFDFLTKHHPLEEGEKDFVQYVGNGNLGASMDHRGKIYIKGSQVLSQSINFYPVVQVDISGYQSQEAFVTNIREGVITKVQCFKVEDKFCVTSTQQMYAHRGRPGVLVQEFRIQNPSDVMVTVDLEQIGLSDWKDAVSDTKRAEQIKSTEIKYSVITGTHKVEEDSNQVYVIGIASMQLPLSVTVQATATWSHHILTVVRYVMVPKDSDTAETRRQMEAQVDEELNSVIIVNRKLLKEEHTQIWDQLWFSGFGISKSLAPGAINGDNINMTFYYVMSNTLSPIHEFGTLTSQKRELEKLLYFPDRCYENHHTVQNDRMWIVPKTVHRLNQLTNTWMVTLRVSSCATMLQAGADGALQSMMLSIGGLQFKNQHLEFRTQPKDLHRDYLWRRLNYGNNTHLNMSVIVGDDNKALIHAALDRNDRSYYACDAGCLDPPVKLSRELNIFPVKLTEPLTPLLYITFDKEHMEQLKHTIHLKDIKIAPAHEHHVLAMHRHGHHLGGLPVLFWGSLGFLILVFHLFLGKLIYNEYCVSAQDRYSRGRYSL